MFILVVIVLLIPLAANAQKRAFTIEDLYRSLQGHSFDDGLVRPKVVLRWNRGAMVSRMGPQGSAMEFVAIREARLISSGSTSILAAADLRGRPSNSCAIRYSIARAESGWWGSPPRPPKVNERQTR